MSWFRSSVKVKLGFVVVLMACVSIVVGVVAVTRLGEMNARLHDVVDVSSARAMFATRIQRNLTELHREEKNLVLATSIEDMDKFAAKIESTEADLAENLVQLESLTPADELPVIEQFREAYGAFTNYSHKVRDETRKNTDVRARQLSAGPGNEHFTAAEHKLFEIVENYEHKVSELQAKLSNDPSQADAANLAKLSEATGRMILVEHMVQEFIELERIEKQLLLAQSDEEAAALAAHMTEVEHKFAEELETLRAQISEQGQALLAEFEAHFAEWLAVHHQVSELSIAASNRHALEISKGPGREAYQNTAAILYNIVESADAAMARDKQASEASYEMARNVVVGATVIGVSAGAVFAWFIVHQISLALGRVVPRVKAIADGDLSGEELQINGKDEIASLMTTVNAMNESLRDMIGRVKTTSHEVAGAATEVAGAAEELSGTVDSQQTQIHQVSAAVEELSRSVTDVAQSCNGVRDTADGARTSASEGGDVVSQTVQQMREIANTVETTAKSIRSLGDQAEAIAMHARLHRLEFGKQRGFGSV
ncbi:MAG: methyl-accepting chemotaxis protein, partial [Planctomycetota bacterium]